MFTFEGFLIIGAVVSAVVALAGKCPVIVPVLLLAFLELYRFL